MVNRKNIISYLARTLAIALFLIVSLALIAALIFTSPPGERYLRGILETKLKNILHAEISIKRLETNLTSYIYLKGVRLSQVENFASQEILEIGDIKIEYKLLKLLHKEIVITSAAIKDVEALIHRDSQGRFNIALLDSLQKSRADTTKKPIPIFLESLSLKNLSVNYTDDFSQFSVRITNCSAEAKRFSDIGYHIKTSIDSIGVEYDSLSLQTSQIAANGNWANHGLDLAVLALKLDDLDIDSRARIQFDQPSISEGNLTLTGNPNSLLQALSTRFHLPAIVTSGNLDLSVQFSGWLDDPDIYVQCRLPQSDIGNVRFQDGFLETRMKGNLVSIDSLNLQVFDGSVFANGLLSLDTLLESRLNASIAGLNLAGVWSSIHEEESPYKGNLNGNLSLSGHGRKIKDWSLTADARATQAKYRGQPLPDFYTTLSLANSIVSFRIHESHFNIEANTQIRDKKIAGNFTIDIDQLEPLVGFFNLSELQGTLRGSGTISGTTESPEIRASIIGEHIHYQNFPVDTIIAKFKFQEQEVFISELDFCGQADAIDSAHSPFHIEHLSGSYRYVGKASGSLDSLHASIEIELQQPTYSNYSLDSAKFSMSIRDQHITLTSAILHKDSLASTLQGDYHLNTKKGSLSADFYSLSQYANTSAVIKEEYTEFQNQLRPIGTLSSQFDFAHNDRVSLSAFVRGCELQPMSHLLSDNLDIGGELDVDLQFSGNMRNPNARVELNIQRPRFQSLTLDSIVASAAIKDNKFLIRNLQFFSSDQQLSTNATVALQRDDAGHYKMSKHCPLQGSAKCRNVDLRILKPFIPSQMELSGRTSMNLKWEGTFESLHPEGWFALEDTRLLLRPDTDPIDQINLRVSIQDTVFRVESATGVIRETPISLNGQVITSAWKEFVGDLTITLHNIGSVAIDGIISPDSLYVETHIQQLDIGILQPFLPDLQSLAGSLSSNAILSGSIGDPILHGDLEVRQLSFQPSLMDNPFKDGMVKVSFDEDQIVIDTMFIKMNGGTILLRGNLVHDRRKINDVNINASISQVSFSRPKSYVINISSAELTCQKQKEYFLLDGDVQLGDSRIITRFKPQSILPWAQKVDRPKSEIPSLMQQIQMNIRIRESSQLWVDNNLAHIRLHTELGIIGSPARPNLSGRISIEEGYLIYLDRKFRVKQGVIYFVDPNRFNPEVDLKAEAKVTSYSGTVSTPYTITLDIHGPLDEAVVNISSVPELEKSDIISLLTLGQTRSQLMGANSEGEGGLRNALVDRAGALSSQTISGYVSRKVGTFLGLEQVTVEGNLFRFNRMWGPQLLASKRISDRAELTYSTTVGYINDQSIRLDYLLSRHFSVEGQTDQRGKANVSLKYSLRFR